MANIAQKVASIRQAIFGKDVRESIASGIEAINSEIESTTAKQNVIDNQEHTRIDAENIRLSNENTRKSNEDTRKFNEDTRKSNEDTRQTQETSRKNTFDTNEASRKNTFDTNENDRGTQFGSLKNELNESIDNANTATETTNLATSKYMDIVDQTKKIYKPVVNTYSDISTIYPDPEIGWTVVTKDDHIEHRWDCPIVTGKQIGRAHV